MARHHVILAATAMALPLPATATPYIVGTSPARSCYEAADRLGSPSRADFQVCDTALEAAGTLRTEVVATHVNRGILSMRAGRLDAAMADFDRAMVLDPNEPEAYLNRGSLLLKRNEVRPALAMFDAALARNTKRPELAYFARAVAHESLGNVRAAFADYRRASQLAPMWTEPKLELARFQVRPRQ